MKKLVFLGLVFVLLSAAAVWSAAEREYPAQPIQMVVPYGPGGGTDIFARNVIRYSDLADDIVVRNIDGAGGRIGTTEVINSDPDGYTLLAHVMAISIGYHAGLYDTPPWQDLDPICSITIEDNAISVKADAPWETIEDLIDYASNNPGQVQWGFAGVGGTTHTVTASFANETEIDINYTPFSGGAESRTALAGGHIDAISSQVSEVIDMVDAGDLRILATTGDVRNALTPDVPTLVERDIDFVFQVWRGFFAPKGTDPEIIKTIADSFEEASENPELIQVMSDLGFDIGFKGTEEFIAEIERNHESFADIGALLRAEN